MGNNNFDLLNPDRHADAFTDLMYSFGNYPLISKPTRITSMTLLDNIWTNNLNNSIVCAILTDIVSDHFAIIQCTEIPFGLRTKQTKLIRDSNPETMNYFRVLLESEDLSLVFDEANLDKAFLKLHDADQCLQQSLKRCLLKGHPKTIITHGLITIFENYSV